jgi:hypothetical protein
MLIIPATGEIQIGRIKIPGQSEQKVSEIPIPTNNDRWLTPVIPAM